MSDETPTLPAEAYEECGECGHYPAYCNELGCKAWVADDTPSGHCACTGRKPPKKKPAPSPEAV